MKNRKVLKTLANIELCLPVFILLAFSRLIFPLEVRGRDNIITLNQQYFEIRKLMGGKRYQEAIAQSKKFIEQNPSFSEIYPVLVQASKEADRLDKTIDFFHGLNKKSQRNVYFYYGLGLCYQELRDDDQAAAYYKKAIDLEAQFPFVYNGLINSCRKDFSALIHYFQEKIKYNPDNSFLHYGLGFTYEQKLKNFDLALNAYQQALDTARKAGDKTNERKHLNTIGNFYWGRSNFSKALGFYEQALELAQQAGNKTEEARYLHNCGLIHCYTGHSFDALEHYELALKIDLEIGNKTHEAQMLRGMGYANSRLGNYSQALDYYQQALILAQAYADSTGEGRYLADIASVHEAKGNYSRAIEFYQQALLIAQESRDKYNEKAIFKSLGNTYWKIGNFAKVLEYNQRALNMSEELGDKVNKGESLINIGLIYFEMGELAKALEYYFHSLDVAKETGSKSTEGVCLNNVAEVYLRQKNYSQALDYTEQALKIARETRDKSAEANRINNMAIIHNLLGDYSQALKYHDEALKIIKEIGNKEREAGFYRDMGFTWSELNNYPEAEKSFQKSIALALARGILTITWGAEYGLASVYEKQQNYQDAAAHYKKSIDSIENMRAQFRIEDQKAGFLQDKIKVYASLVNVLFELHEQRPDSGFDKEAFYFAEKAKARAFLDSLEEAKLNIKEILPAETREEENRISKEISNIQTELANPNLPESRRKELFEKLEGVEDNYQKLIQRMRRNVPEYANLVYPEPFQLEKIQEKLLDEQTALVEYLMGEDRSFLFYVTKDDLLMRRLAKSEELQEKIKDYITLLSTRETKDFKAYPASRKFYQELVSPIGEKLLRIKKLIIVPDGQLNYLPFETLLRSESRCLVEDYRISYAPSASSLISLRERKRGAEDRKDLLAFANPVYGFGKKPREEMSSESILREAYLEQGFTFFPLKYSEKEVNRISKFVKKKFKDTYTQDKAKEEKLKAIPLKDYKIIHFATHGILDEKVPLRSSLVLTLDSDPDEDGFFQAREIYNTDLSADLVVLSACQTGKGKLEKGEGVTGLSRAFLYAGAQSVLASLWNINDRTTSNFMEYFYQALSAGKSKGEALQLAKIKMIHSKYSHPFHWAAFILIGDSDSSLKINE